MKYLALFLLATWVNFATADAQSKDTTKSKAVSAPAISDSTAVLQGRDLQELVNLIQDYPAKYANPITQWLQQRYQLRLGELLKKEKH